MPARLLNYGAQDAAKAFLGKPVVFRMHLDICYLAGAQENAIRVSVLQQQDNPMDVRKSHGLLY